MTDPLEGPAEPPHAPDASVTSPADSGSRADRRPPATVHTHEPTIAEICPYLTAASGAWRSVTPHREHRCGAVDPPAPLSSEKQRRLCLAIEHAECPAFRAARASRAAMLAPGLDASVVAVADAARRPIARTSAVVLEHPRLSAPTARWPLDRGLSQIVLVVLMVLAFAAVAVARLSSSDSAGAPPVSPSPSVAVAPSPTPRPTATPIPSPSGAESPGASASVAPSEDPAVRTTYKVKKGDTLVGIASTFETSVAAIRKLNELPDDATLRVGQVLKIP
ncbi:MAG TPA: LysM peptidoglycan-binding domain-containing protein [Candidatus Limnocylindrales bacterium]|nr:LysM peptidoglycan-binding domain-containing protein [Candidatus Limnocylindrales bacterium]